MLKLLGKLHFNILWLNQTDYNNHFSAYENYEAMRIMTKVYIETLPTELKLYENHLI